MIRSRVVYLGIALIVILTFLLSSCAPPAPAELIQMKFATFWTEQSGTYKIWGDFCKEIAKRSNNMIQITYYPGGSLLDTKAMADGISTGAADMGYISVANFTGRFPVTEGAGLQPGSPSAYVSSHVADDYLRQFNPKELGSYYLLAGAAIGPHVIFSKQPIRTLDDIKGKKLRSVGRASEELKLLGGTPVGTPPGEVYDAINKAVLDGAMMSMEAAQSWNLAEVTKYVTDLSGLTNHGIYLIVMNKDRWDKLPQSAKTIIEQVSKDWVDKSAIEWNETDVVGAKYAKQKGVELISLSAAELTKWQAAGKPVIDNYVKDLVGRGYTEKDAQGFIDFARSRNEYWLKKQVELGIKSATGPADIRIK